MLARTGRRRRVGAPILACVAVASMAAFASPPAAAAPPAGGIRAADHHLGGELLARDSFTNGTGKWAAELESGGTVVATHGILDIDVPGGASLWFKRQFAGPVWIEYTATPISAGGPNDHVTDLNAFWNARDVRSPDDLFATARTGAFADYDLLKTYYVGFGANLNTTTRMRRYVGEQGNRPLLFDLTGPLLVANRPYRVRLVADGSRIQYWSDGQLIFDYDDPDPYTGGWFAFRTVASHFTIRDFSVRRPPACRDASI